jgi:glycosyltransferase involved in cell wall biosynthesis
VDNVAPLFNTVKQTMDQIEGITYSHLFIDNASNDGTQEKLRELAKVHPNLQIILNNRNYGDIRSPWYGYLQAKGDCIIHLNCNFKEPPELIPIFVKYWLEGCPVVIGVKKPTKEFFIFRWFRTTYYHFSKKLSDVEIVEHFNGYALFDRQVIETFRELPDMYPYVRGLIVDLGFAFKRVTYEQGVRKRGFTKNNFYSLYNTAMLGITSHSKVPLRLATFIGFVVSILSLLVGAAYLIFKLMYFDRYEAGIAPLVIGLFFFGAVQLFFIGIIGEYIGSIHTQVLKRPLVIEKERINFGPELSDDDNS